MQNVCVGEKHARFFQYNNSDLLHEVNKVIDANENNLVIYIKNVMKKNLMNKPVTKELNQAMEGRCTIAAGEGEDGFVKVTDEAQFKQEIMYPIICQGDVLGTVLMMSIDMKPKFTDNEKKMVKTAANFLGKHMES